MGSGPTSMPTGAGLSFPRLRLWLPARAQNSLTYTSPSRAWKICFCTIPEGVCAIELESFWRDAGPRRPCGAAECDSTLLSDVPATAAFRFHFRPRDGEQRLHAATV